MISRPMRSGTDTRSAAPVIPDKLVLPQSRGMAGALRTNSNAALIT